MFRQPPSAEFYRFIERSRYQLIKGFRFKAADNVGSWRQSEALPLGISGFTLGTGKIGKAAIRGFAVQIRNANFTAVMKFGQLMFQLMKLRP